MKSDGLRSGVLSIAPLAALLGAVLALVPALAQSEIYQWVDEKGTTVFSNIRPANPRGLKNFQVTIADDKGPAAVSARPLAPAPTAEAAQRLAAEEARADALYREQALRERVANLERQIQATQVAAPVSAPSDYYGGYPGYGYPADYGYSSFGYPYGYPLGYGIGYIVPSRVFVPSSGFRRPGFAPPRFGSTIGMPRTGGFRVGGVGGFHVGGVGHGRR